MATRLLSRCRDASCTSSSKFCIIYPVQAKSDCLSICRPDVARSRARITMEADNMTSIPEEVKPARGRSVTNLLKTLLFSSGLSSTFDRNALNGKLDPLYRTGRQRRHCSTILSLEELPSLTYSLLSLSITNKSSSRTCKFGLMLRQVGLCVWD